MGLGSRPPQTGKVTGQPSVAETKIVGIVFVRNEDRFVEHAVRNAADFCDEVILADRRSTDRTPQILGKIAAENPAKFRFHTLDHPRQSHDLLQPYVGRDVWIFAVDGDEIYDAQRLVQFRSRLLAGEFARHWMILGNVVHCREFDPDKSTATGFATPPSRSMVKLYNFAAIDAWDGDTPERLHGGRIAFRLGYHEQAKLELFKSCSWEDAPLRCLHMCFLPRSSADRKNTLGARESIIETFYGGWTGRLRRWLARILGRAEASPSKTERYARGEPVTVSTTPFFP